MTQTSSKPAHLDPGKECGNGDGIGEASFPVAEMLKICKQLWVGEQRVQLAINLHRSIHVEHNANNRNQYDHDVQDVPHALEVGETMLLYLQ